MTDTEAMEKVKDATVVFLDSHNAANQALNAYLKNAPAERETIQEAIRSVQFGATLLDDLANQLARVLVAVQE